MQVRKPEALPVERMTTIPDGTFVAIRPWVEAAMLGFLDRSCSSCAAAVRASELRRAILSYRAVWIALSGQHFYVVRALLAARVHLLALAFGVAVIFLRLGGWLADPVYLQPVRTAGGVDAKCGSRKNERKAPACVHSH